MPNRIPSDADLLPTVLNKAESIAARIGPTIGAGCWEWVGALAQNGYGTLTVRSCGSSRSLRAHRAVFMLHHGRKIADGMTIHHTCHVRACVNPAHLVEMTQLENQTEWATGGGSIRYRPTKAGVPRWAVLFREDGKQRSKAFGSLEAAEAFAEGRKVAA